MDLYYCFCGCYIVMVECIYFGGIKFFFVVSWIIDDYCNNDGW